MRRANHPLPTGVIQTIALLLMGLVLSGCGFQLRGTQQVASDLHKLEVTGDREVITALRPSLNGAGITIDPSANYQLKLLSYNTDRRAAAFNGGSVAQYLLTGKLEWSLTTADGTVILGPEEISSQRLYNYENTTTTGAISEESLLRKEMLQDLGQRVVSRLAAMSNAELQERTQKALEAKRKAEEAAGKAQPHMLFDNSATPN